MRPNDRTLILFELAALPNSQPNIGVMASTTPKKYQFSMLA